METDMKTYTIDQAKALNRAASDSDSIAFALENAGLRTLAKQYRIKAHKLEAAAECLAKATNDAMGVES